jgi:hypothetical protein
MAWALTANLITYTGTEDLTELYSGEFYENRVS